MTYTPLSAVLQPGVSSPKIETVWAGVSSTISRGGHHPYYHAQSLEDLRDGLTLVRILLRMGKLKEAYHAQEGLTDVLLNNLGAATEALSLLRPFFRRDWTTPPAGLPRYQADRISRWVEAALDLLG